MYGTNLQPLGTMQHSSRTTASSDHPGNVTQASEPLFNAQSNSAIHPSVLSRKYETRREGDGTRVGRRSESIRLQLDLDNASVKNHATPPFFFHLLSIETWRVD